MRNRKGLLLLVCVMALVLALCACGSQQPDGTTAPQTTAPAEKELTGITFAADPVWRTTESILQNPNTIEAWFQLPSGSANRDDIILTTQGNEYADSSRPLVTLLIDANGHPVLEWVHSKEYAYTWRFDDANVRNDQWTHIATVRDVEAGRIHCYINGQLVGTVKDRSTMDILPVCAYCVGGDHSAQNNEYFSGQIHSVAVFSTARTEEQIAQDMEKPAGDGMLFAYQFDAVDGDKVTDLSGNGYDLTKSVRWFSEKEPVTDYAYSLMVVPDTQVIARWEPDNFSKIYDYIVQNVAAKKVQYVIGVGDITNDDTDEEWAVAKAGISKMNGVVPYSLARGNTGHDSAKKFNATFPISQYQHMVKGSFNNDMCNVYHTFEVGNVKYLLLVLDCNPTNDMVDWANNVIAANPDRNVIISTHVYLYKDGTPMSLTDAYPGPDNTGDHLWEKLISKHENICLVLCGHDPSAQLVLTQTKGEKGNTVSQLLVNGQGVDDGVENGCGFVATLYFSEDGKDVTVEYYSTIKEKYFLTENQFSFTVDVID